MCEREVVELIVVVVSRIKILQGLGRIGRMKALVMPGEPEQVR